MTALAANQDLEHFPGGRNVYDLVAAVQVWAGGLVGVVAASGLVQAWANSATDAFLGVALENALEGATVLGQAVDVVAVHDEGMIVKNIPIAAAVQTSVRLEVYCTTDNIREDAVLDAGATSRAIGRIIRFRSAADCDIELYSAAQWNVRYNTGAT